MISLSVMSYVSGRAAKPGQAATKWREAFGVRRIPALLLRAVRNSHKAPEYGALQTLRALVCQSVFSLQMHSKNLRENDRLSSILLSAPPRPSPAQTAHKQRPTSQT